MTEGPGPVPQLILASASPARLATLRGAGINPEVIVSGIDESGVTAPEVAGLVTELARLKARAVQSDLGAPSTGRRLIIGCDSLLDFGGVAHGKPGSVAEVVTRWRQLRGNSGILRTGHHLILSGPDGQRELASASATVVHFADISDAEIEAYANTGEPAAVAGGFTLDGLGGPLISGIEGDPHGVVGISLPLLRTLLLQLGLGWPGFGARS